jgi:hypothetical protein
MNEIYIDRISNISIQGPVVSLDFARAVPISGVKEVDFEAKVKITLTIQNFMTLINTLNQTAQAISKKSKEQAQTVKNGSKSKSSDNLIKSK